MALVESLSNSTSYGNPVTPASSFYPLSFGRTPTFHVQPNPHPSASPALQRFHIPSLDTLPTFEDEYDLDDDVPVCAPVAMVALPQSPVSPFPAFGRSNISHVAHTRATAAGAVGSGTRMRSHSQSPLIQYSTSAPSKRHSKPPQSPSADSTSARHRKPNPRVSSPKAATGSSSTRVTLGMHQGPSSSGLEGKAPRRVSRADPGSASSSGSGRSSRSASSSEDLPGLKGERRQRSPLDGSSGRTHGPERHHGWKEKVSSKHDSRERVEKLPQSEKKSRTLPAESCSSAGGGSLHTPQYASSSGEQSLRPSRRNRQSRSLQSDPTSPTPCARVLLVEPRTRSSVAADGVTSEDAVASERMKTQRSARQVRFADTVQVRQVRKTS